MVEIAQTVLATMDTFRWFVIGFGDMRTFSRTLMTPIDTAIMDGVIAMTVQLFFSWRIWVRDYL